MSDISNDKILGGLYGALIADAVGVPYEFTDPVDMPTLEQIDIAPPRGFKRAHATVPIGTWSDDGSMMLCVLDALLQSRDAQSISPYVLMELFVEWRDTGKYAVDNRVYDVGMTTSMSIDDFKCTKDPITSGQEGEYACGNGSLMRVLPVALLYPTDMDIARTLAERQSVCTHAHIRVQIACAVYVNIAQRLLQGLTREDAINQAILWAHNQYDGDPVYHKQLVILINGRTHPALGTGYVVDSLWSALHAFSFGSSYEDVVKRAIAFGRDTDTTACIAGGLAGIYFGKSGIPDTWLDQLRGVDIVTPLVDRIGLPL